MDAVQIIFLILLWGIPIIRFMKIYRKLEKEEQEEIKASFKNPLYYLGDGFGHLGLLLIFTGMIIAVPVVQHIGAALLFVGWFYGGVELLDVSYKKSAGVISFSVIATGAYYFFLI
ncbi:hypothetical protein [Mesobacillus jeotgali]|uniref:hypothetical protein n=1 Tax=Mesobacillus jeotgali TaxID=129985 RepID=UPI001117A8B4|nr:hypothetical protein [Mesobacillus jeotgali]